MRLLYEKCALGPLLSMVDAAISEKVEVRPVTLAAFAMKKLSSFFPDLRASRSQSGCKPRPAQVCDGSFGLRYFGGTDPIGRWPRPFPRVLLGS
jgi:hypothetical protein